MSNWEHANEAELDAAREAYALDDPKHPDYMGGTMAEFPMEASGLNASLAAAQGEFPAIPRSKTVETGSYSFSYAPLDAILDAVRPVLAKHGLALTQMLEDNGLRTELRHAGGGVIGASFPLPRVPDSPQQLGSLLTYLRRYAIVAILGIAAEEDDDTQAAVQEERSSPFQIPDLAKDKRQIRAILSKLSKAEIPGFEQEAVDAALELHYGTKRISELNEKDTKNLLDRLLEKEKEHGL